MQELLSRWERVAAEMDAFTQPGSAVVRRCCGELREALRAQDQELLSAAQAAALSGYTERRLRQMVKEKKLTNHGERNRPRYRRAELPRKAKGVEQKPMIGRKTLGGS